MNFPIPSVDASFTARLCLALVHSLWQAGALAASLWLVERLWKRLPAEAAYTCYVAALVIALLAVPVTFACVDELPSIDAGTFVHVATADDVPARAASAAAPPKQPLVGGAAAPVVAAPPLEAPRVLEWPPVIERVSRSWVALAPWIAALYVCGVVWMFVRILRGVWFVGRLRARATLVHDGPLAEVLASLSAAWRLRVVPALAHVEGIAVPKVVGLVRPTILLPLAAAGGVSIDELEMILAHELAHVRRHDLWVNLLQRLAEAVLFFNPGLWILSRRISLLREYCCDESTCRALSSRGAQAHLRYAQALLHVAELTQRSCPRGAGRPVEEVAALAIGRSPSELRRRVARLVGEPLREPLQLSRGAVLVLATAVLVLLLAPAISFSSARPATETKIEDDDAKPHAAAPPADSGAADHAADANTGAVQKGSIAGSIVLEDGTPATAGGWLYSYVKSPRGNSGMSLEDTQPGRFDFPIRPGTVWLSYFADEYAPAWVGPLEVAPGQRIEDLELVLSAGVPLAVHVKNEQGEPIPEASVLALPVIGGSANGPGAPRQADTDGTLVLDHVADTPYQFRVSAPGYQPLRTQQPGLANNGQLDLVLKPSRPTTGIVVDAQGQPAAGATLHRRVEQTEGWANLTDALPPTATTDSQGRFTLDQLADGYAYLFLVETRDGARVVAPTITAGQQNVRIEVPPRRDLRVRLIGDIGALPQRRGKPLVGVRQHYLFRPANVAGTTDDLIGKDVYITPSDEGGLAEYQGLIEGDVEITAGQLKRTVASQPGVTEVVLHLPGAGPGNKAVISGRIVLEDGSPVAPKGALIWDVDTGRQSVSTMVDQSSADFEISVIPGTAWLSFDTADFAPALVGPLQLQPGQRVEDMRLVLGKGRPLTLEIKNQEDQPIAGANIVAAYMVTEDSSRIVPNLTTGDSGQAVLQHTGSMRYRFRVAAAGYQPLDTGDVVVPPTGRLELTLTPSEPTTGVVLDGAGRPAAGAVLRRRVRFGDGHTEHYSRNDVSARCDAEGRFVLDQLARDSTYLFEVETVDGARRALTGVKAGEKNLEIRVPPRRDLRVHLVGDLDSVPEQNGKRQVYVQQSIEIPSRSTSIELISQPLEVTPGEDGGVAELSGLFDVDVRVSLDTTAGERSETVKLRNGINDVEVQLPVAP